jgi:BirA family transcriptional regulator, biotin operon repressor / biotin---[acetyl-CoA-carboxylase] ligase
MNIALLETLRAAGGDFVAFDRLGPDVFEVFADLDELEAFGYTLERHPYQGVAYRGPAPRLCLEVIRCELGTEVVGRHVNVFPSLTSTNDLLAEVAALPDGSKLEGSVVFAEEQTSGRGRRGRSWSSPPGSSILMSVLLFPKISIDDLGWLTALGAVAVAEVVSRYHGLDARIKWPNDVRVDGRKLAGVLVERGQGTVLGIGLNVNVVEFPGEIRDSATSMQRLLGRPLDRSEIARSLIQRLDFHHSRAVEAGPDSLNDPYRRHSEHLGHAVEVTTSSEVLHGRLVDLDLRAGLTLELLDGRTWSIAGRDVVAIVNHE